MTAISKITQRDKNVIGGFVAFILNQEQLVLDKIDEMPYEQPYKDFAKKMIAGYSDFIRGTCTDFDIPVVDLNMLKESYEKETK